MDVIDPKGSSDVWQITIDKFGGLIGSYNFGGSEFDRGTSITKGQWGSLFITGYSRSFDGDMGSNKGENDIFLMYLPDDGSELKTMTLGGERQDFAYDVLVQRNGGVIVVGQSFSKNPPFDQNKGESDILVARWR
jgi:hypothetical protein